MLTATNVVALLLVALYVPAIHSTRFPTSFKFLPSTITHDTSKASFVSTSSGLDGPKMSSINSSSFEWWYFDAVSLDNKYSVNAIFFTSPNTSFPLTLSATQTLEVLLSVQTPEEDVFYANAAYAHEALVNTVGNGASGIWTGTGSSFTGSPALGTYTVDFLEAQGVTGTVIMKSVSPAHYPCNTITNGANMEILPHVGWSIAIPDAQAIVDLKINGKHVAFTGSGYHDKNWGDQPFTDSVSSWYWGHGRLGPYSIVWLDTISTDGKEYSSGYVSKNGQILGVSCSGVKVRPLGPNTTFPPVLGSALPEGFSIEIDLGKHGVFEAKAEAKNELTDVGVYTRWSGELSGGMRGLGFESGHGSFEKGTAIIEQFVFSSE